MNNPYDAPKANVAVISSQQFSLRNAVIAFLAGSILVPALIFFVFWLLFRADGTGNLSFWSAIVVAALIGAVIAGRFSRLSVFGAAVVGVAMVVVVSIVGGVAIAAWAIASSAV